MITVISPAKKLDFDAGAAPPRHTQPAMLKDAAALVRRLRALSASELSRLMGVSPALAELNRERYRAWRTPFTPDNARAAIFAFRGDVYQGLDADTLSRADLDFAQRQLRILSGLYGVLKPFDLIQPYRLEMGARFKTPGADNLYAFWGERLTDDLNKALAGQRQPAVVNLASQEYFKSLRPRELRGPVFTPVFQEERNGRLRVISFNAKRARGMMSRYILQHRIEDPQELKAFDLAGYRYQDDLSDEARWVFARG